MNFKTSLRLSCAASFLTISLWSAQRIIADAAPQGQIATPSSSMTTVLLPKEAEALFKFYYNSDALFGKQDKRHKVIETYYTPNAADVSQLETDLAAYTKTSAYADDLRRNGAENWSHPLYVTSYFRQYAGVMRSGKKIVLINGFAPSLAPVFVSLPSHTNKGEDWHDQAIIVCDGGCGFFHATYDPASHKIEGLQFNGFI